MKKIILLSTGGTIASTARQDGLAVAGALAGEKLVKQIQVREGIELHVHSVLQKASSAITLADLCLLHNKCQAMIDTGDIDGIVITHGTDTLEDTAYFLETTLRTDNVVVVVTGSQRVPHAMGTDAFINLQNAIHIAADEQARNMGVLVAFNEMIYGAAFVRKVSSFQVNGFDAPALGCLGLIDNGAVTIYQRPVRLPVLEIKAAPSDFQHQDQPSGSTVTPVATMAAAPLPAVDILSVYLDARPELFDAAVHSGARGIVIDGLGRGNVPASWMPAIIRAIDAGVIVLMCTSTLHGPVHQSYDFQGSLHTLENAGAIGISGLTARKARIRLMVLLSQRPSLTRQAVVHAFTLV